MKLLYGSCIDAIRRGDIDLSASHMKETTMYAVLATNHAWDDSYGDTLKALSFQLQQNKTISHSPT
jgi:hypothetical protein